MKALKYLTLLLLAPLAASCSQEGLTDADDGYGKLHEVRLTFDFTLDSSTGSRSPRPLETSDNWQKVSDMRIYVFRSSTGVTDESFVLYHPNVRDEATGRVSEQPYLQVTGFEKNSDDIWKEPTFEQHMYQIVPMLGEGYYRFLAVGRDDEAGNTPLELNWTKGLTSWRYAMMENTGGSPRVSEVFTGYPMNTDGTVRTIRVTGADSFTEHITCRRTVAGVLLYVKNIPVRLTTEYAWHGEGSPTGAISQDVEKGVECSVDEVAIVSAGYSGDVNLMSRRHGDVFIKDQSRFKATRIAWVSTSGMETDETGNYYVNKAYSGSFVFPAPLYDKSFTADYAGGEKADAGNYTVFDKSLYLCFFHISGSGKYYPIKMMPIKIVRSDVSDSESESICAGDYVISADGLHYNLVANHLYCLGVRNEKNKEDDPIDLKDALKNPELKITVIGNWQADVDITM